jgi:hypothetical protein
MKLCSSVLPTGGFVCFFVLTSALQSPSNHRRRHRVRWASTFHDAIISPTTPGALRRRLFGEATPMPRIDLPLPLISAVVAALKEPNPMQAIPVFLQVLSQEQTKNAALPIAYKPFSELSFPEDCIADQLQVRLSPPPPFLLELTPWACNLDPSDRQGQRQWLLENAEDLRNAKLLYGGVHFRSWSLFKNADGVEQAWQALGLTPCRDPKEIRGPAPLLDGSSTIYETLNNQADAATHLGLHFEGIPGIMPTSALFSCFQAADSGGEFMLCDGRRVFRDLDTNTLASLQAKKLRPTFAELPNWIANSPLSFLPFATELHLEILALFTDLMKPTDDFFLDVFPEANGTQSLKLTTHPAVPVLNHPVTNQPVFFSGIDAGHQGNFQRNNPHLTSDGKYASEVFDVRYGTGKMISEMDLVNIREACEANTRALVMKPGDAVYLDNFTTLHGRKPFVGTRKHTVVWFLD